MKWLFNNWLQRIAALVLAVMVWQLVIRIEQPSLRTTFDNVLIDFRNRPAELAITSGPNAVSVEVSAIGGEPPRVKLEDIVAWVDLSKADPGKSNYRVRLIVPQEILAKAKVAPRPEFVSIELQRVVSRTLKIGAPQFVGATERYVLGDEFRISPDSVTISGPQAAVMEADFARITVDISRLEPGVAYERPVTVVDGDGHAVAGLTISPSRVTFSPSLAPRPEEKNVLISPVWAGIPAVGYKVIRYELTPNQVSVSGDPQVLARVYTLNTEPIDINNLQESREFRVGLQVPQGLRPKRSDVTVRVVVSKDSPPAPDS